MKIAVISTGTELLKGSAVNTNAAFLGGKLTGHGFAVSRALTAGDGFSELCTAFGDAVRQCDTLIVSGGLGPTRDDVTLDAAARFFGMSLTEDPALVEKVTAHWLLRHSGHVPKTVLRQARKPANGIVLDNPNGSAAGHFFEAEYRGKTCRVFLLPGPPREFEPMVENALLKQLENLRPECFTVGFLAAGEGEFQLQQKLEALLAGLPVTIGYCARAEGTRIFLSGDDPETVKQAAENARAAIGPHAFPGGELELVPHLAKVLEMKKYHLVTAESCTGGGIGSLLTDYPGISSVFNGGVIVYSNELKHRLLGVPEAELEKFGAVSGEVARSMVDGACRELKSECAVAVTGIAGPGGGTPEKPVGLVWIAARAGEKISVQKCHFYGGRRTVRERTQAKALLMLLELLESE